MESKLESKRSWFVSLVFVGLSLLLVAGCAPQPAGVLLRADAGVATWRDLRAGGDFAKVRGEDAFRPDAAQCDYELAQAQSSAPQRGLAPDYQAHGPYADAVANLGSAALSGPAPDFFERCMRARGWEFLGYR